MVSRASTERKPGGGGVGAREGTKPGSGRWGKEPLSPRCDGAGPCGCARCTVAFLTPREPRRCHHYRYLVLLCTRTHSPHVHGACKQPPSDICTPNYTCVSLIYMHSWRAIKTLEPASHFPTAATGHVLAPSLGLTPLLLPPAAAPPCLSTEPSTAVCPRCAGRCRAVPVPTHRALPAPSQHTDAQPRAALPGAFPKGIKGRE